MRDVAMRLFFLFVSLSVVSYVVFLGVGSMMYAYAIEESRVVAVRDAIRSNVHVLSGMVMMHRTCSQLSVKIEKLHDTQFALRFSTWDVPSIPCEEEDTPRPFRAIIFASSDNLELVGSLDEDPLSIVVYRDLATP